MSGLQIRASDAEREAVLASLREHTAAGRLTLEELATRVDETYAARTRPELELVLRELPTETAPALAVRRRSAKWLTLSIFGGTQRRGRWRLPARALVVSIFGGTTLDLRQAELDAPETTIVAISIFGGCDVRVPQGVDVDLVGFALFGGHDESGGTERVHPDSPFVRIVGISLFGGLQVRHFRTERPRLH
jgi:hypothetical protein